MSKDLDKTDQMNPCSECIVDPMCQNACDEFEFYVRTVILREPVDAPVSYYYVSNEARKGESKLLIRKDSKWKWGRPSR